MSEYDKIVHNTVEHETEKQEPLTFFAANGYAGINWRKNDQES